MIAPFLLVEGLDVSLHPSLDALTNSTEAQDVRDGVYEAFDAEGRAVTLAAASDAGSVTAEPGDTAGDRLRALLIAHLQAIDPEHVAIVNADLATTDLASLVKAVSEVQRRADIRR